MTTELKSEITTSSLLASGGVGNIGRAGQRQRLLMGVINLAVASALLVWLDQSSASRWWRLVAFPLLWLGVVGILQARAKTCVALARRRTCDADVAELTPAALDLLRGRATEIVWRGTIIAAVLVSMALLAP